MTGFTLKIIALILMIIDHTGLVVLPWTPWYLPCRILGRIAFPIYLFLLVEGYTHTRDAGKYALRMLIFALISELPFDYALTGRWVYPNYQNVFFTLFLGLCAMILYDLTAGHSTEITVFGKKLGNTHREWTKKREILGIDLAEVGILLIMALAYWANVDYNAFGVLMVLLFYQRKRAYNHTDIVIGAAFIVYGLLGGFKVEGFAALALILIHMYNGERGKYRIPYLVFYALYPIHLFILGVIAHGL